MYHLIPDHLGFLLKREESLFDGNSRIGSQCAALARHTVHQKPKSEVSKGYDWAGGLKSFLNEI